MKRKGSRYRKHLVELRTRIDELEKCIDKRYYFELKRLVTWIGRSSHLKTAISYLNDREKTESDKLVLPVVHDLFNLAGEMWKDIDSKLTPEARKELDSLVSNEMMLKVDQIATKLSSSFSQGDKDQGVDLTHQMRYLVQALVKSEYKDCVSNYTTEDGFLTGTLQTKYKEYVEMSSEYDKLKDNSFWGDWINLQWVSNRLSFGLAEYTFNSGSSKIIRKIDDIFRLRRISQFIFDFNEGLIFDDTQESDPKGTLEGRVWGDIRVDGEVLYINGYGKIEFDPKKKQDGGEDGEGTIQAKFLKEIVDSELEGIDRASIKSIDGGQISARIGKINDRLLHAFTSNEITRKSQVVSVGDGAARNFLIPEVMFSQKPVLEPK